MTDVLERINKRTETEASDFARTNNVKTLRRELDNTIYAFQCLECKEFWKVYQNPCGCIKEQRYETHSRLVPKKQHADGAGC